jgi:parvulin-like peptidyl-prolyl isomerase
MCRTWNAVRRVAPTLFCAAALALGAAGLVGCGGSDDELPKDAVAKVGDSVITKSDFERARKIASDPSDPRDDGAEGRAMESLIKAEWIRQEAKARHVTITDAEVQEAIDQGRQTGFLSQKNLNRAGLTLQQLLPTIRNGQLEIKVTEQLTEPSRRVSDQDIAEYYRRNKEKLIVDERRDVRLVVATTRARADTARAALRDGQSWKVAARKYSVHGASRENGGKVANVREGNAQTGLLATIFRARKGALVGPVKEGSSWALFVVEKVKPRFHATLEQARDEIKQLLSSRRRQRALAAFEQKYRARTRCAPGYRVPRCKDGPKKAGTGA